MALVMFAFMSERFTNLRRVAMETGVPAAWLRREAEAGRVPVVRAGRRLLANPEQVAAALARRAAVSANEQSPHQGEGDR